MKRRTLLATGLAASLLAREKPPVRVLLRSSPAEACSVYDRAAAIVSIERDSPIMGIAAGVPSVLVRQPTDTRKRRMGYDLGMEDWVFEIDRTTGARIARRVVEIGRNLPAARLAAARARDWAGERTGSIITAIT